MASEQPSSAWHPALMPDHEDPAPRTKSDDAAAAPGSSPPASPDSLHNGTPLEPNPQPLDLDNADNTNSDSWFAKEDGEHDEGGAWLASDQSSGLHGVDAAQQQHVATSHSEEQPASVTDTPRKTNAQHSSSMSFARTVSHEISFGDDDDGEWNLSRTNTDPFKFMPPNERTNSFPAVPLMDSDADHDSQPLPSTQALDVLEETEKDSSFESHQDYPADPEYPETDSAETNTLNNNHRGHASSRSIGGQVQGFDAAEAEARYEEGVPLISGPAHDDGESERHGADPFADDDNNEDGFFSHVNENGHAGPPPLERKSTSQVLSAFGPGSLEREDTLETTLEEDENTPAATQAVEGTGNLADKWKEAFGGGDDDDDFLLDDAPGGTDDLDPTAFLGSDDEGLLDEVEQDATPQPSSGSALPGLAQTSGSVYTPSQNIYQQQQPGAAALQPSPSPYFAPPAPANSAAQFGRPPLPGSVSESPKAQSFADRSKGGYSSPYDLPSDIVSSVPKPRRRPSTQSLRSPSATGPLPPLSRTTSAAAGPPLSNSRPPSSHESQDPSQAPKSSTPSLRNKGSSFFEDLPMQSKPRPASRHSNRAQSPSQYPPSGPPMAPQTAPPVSSAMQPPPPPNRDPSGISNLVAPERVSPYAALQNVPNPIPAPSNNAARYSPAPAHAPQGGPVPAAGNRYSPAPSAPRAHSGYSPTRASAATPPVLPHQPRTSSPLAHFETHSSKVGQSSDGLAPSLAERRSSSSSYEPRLHRVPSLPPTREVDEEDDHSGAGASLARQTPPPSATHSLQSNLSPPKRSGSNYAPQPTVHQPSFVPPPRAQTQSPNAVHGKRPSYQSSESAPRPSSAQGQTLPLLKKPSQQVHVQHTRGRGTSLSINMVAPTDGREQDPLQRWKGVPIIAWGVGGTIVTSFPKSIPRYITGSSTPTMLRVPGEVNIKNIKDVEPLPERLANFPGPLKGKSKKKETISWLTSGIEILEKELPDVSFHPELSLEAKRELERLLLWKILRILIENDGVLEGTPAVEKAVRDILSPGTITPTSDNDAMFPGDPRLGNLTAPVTSMLADGADASAMEQIRLSLLKGDREAAVWSAVDKRLWGHALIVANTVSQDLYKKVAQEFVRKEINHSGHANESLGALYMVLSGNHDDCVDELVPSHARAGFQLVSTEAASNPARDLMDGLDKWRETLTLILSNRSGEDVRGLQSLGNLLASYGRVEAAHICFLFSRTISVFGGTDDQNANFVLLGCDVRRQENETEALQLSEVYEYGLSLSGSMYAGAPHLAAYKFRYAVTLAEYGYRERALQYCDSITIAMSSQTKRSPYYNAYLAGAVDDFMIRLKQASKGESSSWISKPSMNKVSDSMWNKFNKFVAGDEPGANTENGPFAAVSSPNLSRSPSVNNFEMYGASPSNYAPAPIAAGVAVPNTAAASKYAPATTAAAMVPNSYEPPHQYGSPTATSGYPGFAGQSHPTAAYPTTAPVENGSYAPAVQAFGYQPSAQPEPTSATSGGYQPYGMSEPINVPGLAPSPHISQQESTNQAYSPASYGGYDPPQLSAGLSEVETTHQPGEDSTGSFEPPSFQPYGYEPPSYQPDFGTTADDDDEAPKPKKKSWGDDEDDTPTLKSKDKGKSDKDRENNEMFRKAAEEDGKSIQLLSLIYDMGTTANTPLFAAKRAAEQQGGKKGWGFGGWFGKRADSPKPAEGPKAVRANLGEASSFVYDPDLKRWVNKKSGAENVESKTATPPPPKAGGPRFGAGTPPPASGTPPPPSFGAGGGGPPRSVSGSSIPGPPRSVPPPGTPELTKAPSMESLRGLPVLAPPMSRSASNTSAGAGPPSAPPSRPTTSMSNASSIDDLLGAPGPRKGAAKKGRKSGRYVDVMAKT